LETDSWLKLVSEGIRRKMEKISGEEESNQAFEGGAGVIK
jgi:hypothetical protein